MPEETSAGDCAAVQAQLDELRGAVAVHRARHRLARDEWDKFWTDRRLWELLPRAIHGQFEADAWGKPEQAFPHSQRDASSGASDG